MRSLNLANQEFEATAEQFRFLARKSINQQDLQKYVRRVLKVKDNEQPSTRTANTIAEIIALAESGKGNNLPSVTGHLLDRLQRRQRMVELQPWEFT